jgi:hypothetical protein
LSVDKNVLFDVKEGNRYWDLKGGAIDGTIWRTGFGRGEGRENVRCRRKSVRKK